MLRKDRKRKPRKNKKNRFRPTKRNLPPESLVEKNTGECKEGMEPCYNTECDRCRQDFEARKPSIEERILVSNNSDNWNQMHAFSSGGKTTHVEKTMADSCITQNNMCIENSRLFHEEDVLWISCMCLLSSVCGICIIILHVVS